MTSSTCWTVWPRSTGRGVCPLRQRRRVHRRCGCGLVPVQRRRHDLHRSRLAMAERLDRVVQRQVPRRVAQRLAVRLAARGPSPGRGLQNRLQHEPAPHRPRRPHTHRVRPAVQSRQPTESRIATGPTIGSPSLAQRLSDLSKHPVRQRSERHPDPSGTAIRFAIRKIRYSQPKGHRPTPLTATGVPGANGG